ncbi:amino acid ABC transporter permease [Polaromonas sp. CT11-55]|uniref:amino acid ABC transporter permease n=1 Tax=Polaromonas sp. CT11-55 TaxID=3243045 RepID=UPI0039A731D1
MSEHSLIPPRPAPALRRKVFSWRSKQARAIVYQVLAVSLIVFLIWLLVSNTMANMKTRGIQSGFDFLMQPAGFDIGEGWLSYDSIDPYWKAFLVGLVNTLRVAVVGIVLTSILGTLLGVGRFSRNALVRALCYGYVETFRNIPVLLQLLMWYLLFTEYLPAVDQALHIGKWVYVSKNGISYPSPVWGLGQTLALVGALVGVVASVLYARSARRHFDLTGKPRPVLWVSLALILGGAVLGWLTGGAPNEWNMPLLTESQVEGGGALSPEYLAVLLGLVLYTSAFVAEVVRAGIASVSLGQHEASASLGLSRGHSMRLVVLPQALRVIIPPLTNQYLNLTKNSSLAVAVGYPDLVSIANTSLNQTGRAVECIAIIMLIYLSTSLATSGLMNWFNSRAAIKER